MIDLIFQVGFSNTVVASALALLAITVSATSQRPQFAYLLWMLVLIKLVTPPIFNLPIELPVVWTDESVLEVPMPPAESHRSPTQLAIVGEPSVFLEETQELSSTGKSFAAIWSLMKPWLGLSWLMGTILIVATSCIRIFRFRRLLAKSIYEPGKNTQKVAENVGRELGLRRMPKILTTTARLCPMVWWIGGRVKIILPKTMFSEMSQPKWRLVLAHELAHVRRGDYLVRWLEWFAIAVFWWNPVVWLAQRNLRAAEEICCDELVLTSLNPGAHKYAESIFQAVESLVYSPIRPPAMASEINSGGFLERRIEMILTENPKRKSSHFWQLGAFAMAALLIPLGFVTAQDFDAVEKRLAKAVQKEELSMEQAAFMMEALRDSAQRHRHDHETHEHEHGHDEHGHDEHGHDEHEHGHEHGHHEHGQHAHKDREHGMHEHRHGHVHGHRSAEENAKLHAVAAEIMMAFRGGDLSEEEAIGKLAAVKQGHLHRDQVYDSVAKSIYQEKLNSKQWSQEREQAYLRALNEMAQSVKLGRVSEREPGEAVAKLWAAKEDFRAEENRRKKMYQKVEKEFAEAVKNDRMTKKQAQQRLKELGKRLWRDDDDSEEREMKYRAVAAEIEELLKSGEISKEQAHDRLQRFRAKLWPKRQADSDRESMTTDEAHEIHRHLKERMREMHLKEHKEHMESDLHRQFLEKERELFLKKAVEDVKEMVESGKISSAEAREKLKAFKQKIEAAKERDNRNEASSERAKAKEDRARELLKLEKQMYELTQRFGHGHPQMEAIKSEIDFWSKEQPPKNDLEKKSVELKLKKQEMSKRLGKDHPLMKELESQIEFWSKARDNSPE